MTFLEWLADELSNTDSDEIEIGFDKGVDLENISE